MDVYVHSGFLSGKEEKPETPSRNTVGFMGRMIQRLFVHGVIRSSCAYDRNLAGCLVPLNDISFLILKTMLPTGLKRRRSEPG